MRRTIILVVGLVFAVALLSRAMTYTVRFTEAAVLTTFGSANAGSEMTGAGLKFKWPDPIQSVTKYDTRSRILQTRSQTQQTQDSKQLEVESFCTWRVKNPLKFFQRFSNAGDRAADHYKKAEEVLRGNLRSAVGEISKYRLNELFSADAKNTKLAELEGKILAGLRASTQDQAVGSLDDYGIEVVTVGINRIVLPESTTQEVFKSMKIERNKLVADLESKGESAAQSIRSAAQQNARRIEDFTAALAADIRKRGDEEALEFVALMNKSPELAVFLKNMDFIRDSMSKRVTLIFSTGMAGFELLSPGAMSSPKRAGVPGVGGLMGGSDVPAARPTTQLEPETPETIAAEPKTGGSK